MGKKGSWFSAIKKVFSSHSKDKLPNESDKKNTREKKNGLAKLRHKDTKSFIPLFREPSSIEKILDEAERDHKHIIWPATLLEQPITPPFVPRAAAYSPRAASPKARPCSPENIPRYKEISYNRLELTLQNQHASATKIQAAYRGYIARRSFRALKGVVRLQGVVRGQSVQRQTRNAMKYMQLLVRLQSQIQSHRIQMLENQSTRRAQYKTGKEVGKRSITSKASNEDWDASLLTKVENDARLQRKVDALLKRERAMSYAYSHQLGKSPPISAQSNLADVGSIGFPLWWNWLERQLPPTTTPENQHMKNFQLTPPRPHSELKPSTCPPSSSCNKQQQGFVLDTINTPTPRSSKSVAYVPSRLTLTPPPNALMSLSKYSRTRANAKDSPSPLNLPMKDDDSMTSCPPFSAPNYMTPTLSARAKARANSNPKERRLSFSLTQGIGSFKRNKGSFFSGGNDSSSQRGVDKNIQSVHSVGNLSVDSTLSMPAAVGRRSFNRFV